MTTDEKYIQQSQQYEAQHKVWVEEQERNGIKVIGFEVIEERSIPELQNGSLTINMKQAEILTKHFNTIDMDECWTVEMFVNKTYIQAAHDMDCDSGFENECLQHIVQELHADKYICEY